MSIVLYRINYHNVPAILTEFETFLDIDTFKVFRRGLSCALTCSLDSINEPSSPKYLGLSSREHQLLEEKKALDRLKTTGNAKHPSRLPSHKLGRLLRA